jgi:hypothetical protein
VELPGGRTPSHGDARQAGPPQARVAALPRTDEGSRLRVNIDLQDDFSMDRALSLYLIETIPVLDAQSETYALGLLTLVESILENPELILRRELDKIKGEAARLRSRKASRRCRERHRCPSFVSMAVRRTSRLRPRWRPPIVSCARPAMTSRMATHSRTLPRAMR